MQILFSNLLKMPTVRSVPYSFFREKLNLFFMQKGHILIIDDDEDEYMIFLIALQDLHVSNRCCYTRSIEQGIKLFQYILPDFIFLDMNMPGLNGLQCLEELKK